MHNLFLSFLDLCQPSYGHHRGPKVLPWDPRRLIFKHSIMSIRCQNFSSIGSIGQKLGVFSIRALKTTPLRPLRVMDQFLDTLLVILEWWLFNFNHRSQGYEISWGRHLNWSYSKWCEVRAKKPALVLLQWCETKPVQWSWRYSLFSQQNGLAQGEKIIWLPKK